MRATIRSKPGGFTIVEIMLALFIFAMVFAAIYSSWLAILRGSQTAMNAAAAVQRSRMAVATLEQALSCTRAFESAMDYYAFVAENGDNASISFVAKLPESFPRSGRFGSYDVRRLTFSVEPGPDSGRQLVLRQNPVLMDLDIDEREHPIVLATEISSLEVVFWDQRSGDWVDEWIETNQLPQMVMFTLQWGGNAQSSQARQEITRVVALPAMAVPRMWQVPGAGPGGPGGPGGPRGGPRTPFVPPRR